MFKRNRVCIRSQRKLIVHLKMISCNLSKTINNVSQQKSDLPGEDGKDKANQLQTHIQYRLAKEC